MNEAALIPSQTGAGFDAEVFRAIEAGLDVAHPERSTIPARVLGFGEISAVLSFDTRPELAGWVFKRLPVFVSEAEARAHVELTSRYVSALSKHARIDVQETHYFYVRSRPDLVVFYAAQRALPSAHIGNSVLHWAQDTDCLLLFEAVLRQVERVWRFNRENPEGLELAVDLQLSNWAIASSEERPRITAEVPLTYIDITTPLLRCNGREQLNTRAFIRGCPALLRWPVRRFLADGVVSRYYEPRTCVIDVIGNCIKEGRGDLLPAMVDVANRFFARRPASIEVNPISVSDVFRYYREDAGIFLLFQWLKKVDRHVKSRVLRQPYDYILPARIERHFPWSNAPRARKR